MMRPLTCIVILLISAVGPCALKAQVPVARAPTPPQPEKESFWRRMLRVSGIAANPSTLKGPEQGASGQIWVAELGGQQTRGLTASGGYRSPVFMPGRTSIFALKGADIVRLPVGGGEPERLYTIDGIIKLVGFSRDDPDQILVLTEGAPGRPRVGWLSVKTGKTDPTPYDTASSEDQRMLEHLRGWDRMYNNTSVYVKSLTKQSLSGPMEWTDVFLKANGSEPINVSRCEEVDCGQPSLSADGRFLVFIKAAMAPATPARKTHVRLDRVTGIPPESPSTHPPVVARMDSVQTGPAPMLPDKTRTDSDVIEGGLAKLRPAKVYFESPDTFFISQPEAVEVILAPLSSRQPPAPSTRIRPDTTRVGSLTEVCLSAPGFKVENESGEEKRCREQVIPVSRNSYWHWDVTALPEIKVSGIRPIDVTINATLAGFPKYTLYTSSHKAYVHVASESFLRRVISVLDEWKALILTIAGIAGGIAPLVKWLKSRRS